MSFQDGLNYAIRQVRIVLDDQVRHPRYIETIPRRGYRFVARVDSTVPSTVATPRMGPRAWTAAVLCAAIFAAATMIIERRPNRHHEVTVTILRSLHDRLF